MAESRSAQTTEDAKTRGVMARALAEAGMTGVRVISLDTAESVLTDRRHELMQAIKHEDPESVRDLARKVDRDKGAVSRDLATLCEAGVVTYEENGRAKRPVLAQEYLVVEPLV